VVRPLLPGSYPFKFVVDGTWCINADYPTYQDGNNTNNIITVLPRDAEDSTLRERLLSPTGAAQSAALELLDQVPGLWWLLVGTAGNVSQVSFCALQVSCCRRTEANWQRC
jgi:hypothetical protein